MKVNQRLLRAALLVAGLVGLYFAASYLSKPRYNGRTLDSWFQEAVDYDNLDESVQEVFRNAGAESVPFLISEINRYRLGPPSRAARIAVRMLGAMGPVARPSVPTLIALLDRTNTRDWVASMAVVWALEKIDIQYPGIDMALVASLKLRRVDLHMLGYYPEEFRPESWSFEARTFQTIKRPSRRAIENLLNALEEKGRYPRRVWIERAIDFQSYPRNKPAPDLYNDCCSPAHLVPCLTNRLVGVVASAAFDLRYSDSELLRPSANLTRSGPLPRPAVDGLLRLLGNSAVRLNAAETLAETHSTEPEVYIPALLGELGGTNCWNQIRAIEALRHSGTHAESALPILREKMSDPVGFVAVWAGKAVEEIEVALKASSPR